MPHVAPGNLLMSSGVGWHVPSSPNSTCEKPRGIEDIHKISQPIFLTRGHLHSGLLEVSEHSRQLAAGSWQMASIGPHRAEAMCNGQYISKGGEDRASCSSNPQSELTDLGRFEAHLTDANVISMRLGPAHNQATACKQMARGGRHRYLNMIWQIAVTPGRFLRLKWSAPCLQHTSITLLPPAHPFS